MSLAAVVVVTARQGGMQTAVVAACTVMPNWMCCTEGRVAVEEATVVLVAMCCVF